VIRAALISPFLLAGCTPTSADQAAGASPVYQGVRTSLLEGDLVQFHVSMTGAGMAQDVDNYAECAAAQYALIRGYGFARHLRTNLNQEGGVWTADAVYTISPSLPRGLRTIDAEVVVADCKANVIPTV
jgi:hypothetical protein